jgi:hypothetical protein
MNIMSEIEATLKQQITRETLSQQVGDAARKLREKRIELIGTCSLMMLAQAGFSDGEDWTAEDEIRSRALCNTEKVVDRLAADVASLSTKHQRLFQQLLDLPAPPASAQ